MALSMWPRSGCLVVAHGGLERGLGGVAHHDQAHDHVEKAGQLPDDLAPHALHPKPDEEGATDEQHREQAQRAHGARAQRGDADRDGGGGQPAQQRAGRHRAQQPARQAHGGLAGGGRGGQRHHRWGRAKPKRTRGQRVGGHRVDAVGQVALGQLAALAPHRSGPQQHADGGQQQGHGEGDGAAFRHGRAP
ncbi:hypothetical protein ACFJGX_15645 [Hydrogenophaga sp. UC242_50]|uniref:hypothetical protein n=1 Tax=Hydrogenophaga sp. UC242_50 TaxID=3350169 RepID=UPI0036D3266A